MSPTVRDGEILLKEPLGLAYSFFSKDHGLRFIDRGAKAPFVEPSQNIPAEAFSCSVVVVLMFIALVFR
jgi:hypothetical protein